MTERLCVVAGCWDLGQHHDDCDSRRCRGCRPRICERGQVCNACRPRVGAELADLPDLHQQLTEHADPADRTAWACRQRVPQPTTDPRRKPAWVWVLLPGDDPVARMLPMGVVQLSRHARVSGSRAQSAPVNLDKLDLAAGARHGSRAPAARGVLGDDNDQVGHLSVATELDVWVRDWRDILCPDQHLPAPTVPELVRWLADRLDRACDGHEEIAQFAADVRALRGTMRAVLGLTAAKPESCTGVPCRSCDRMALFRADGDITCHYCGLYYSERDYADWTEWLAAFERQRAAPSVPVAQD